MTSRIDIGFRVGPSSNLIKVVQPTGGALVNLTLTAGLYLTADALADEIHARLQAYNANLFCAWQPANRTYNFGRSAGAAFDLQFPHPTLRSFLGAAATYTNITSKAVTTPGVFLSTRPWRDTAQRWMRRRTGALRGHNRATSIALAKWREWSVTAMLASGELATFRPVARYMLQGLPFTLALDSSVTSAWAYSNWFGRRTCILAPGQADYMDQWLTEPHQTELEVALELREFAT